MRGIVHAIAKGGAGVVRLDDGTAFVPGALPQETIEFTLTDRRRSVWQGELVEVLEPSPQRVAPPCPLYGRCGGCNLQHLEYAGQLEAKRAIVLANLRRIAGYVPPEPPPIQGSPPWRYRTKTLFRRRGEAIGFYGRHSNTLCPVSSCLLLPPVVEEAMAAWPAALEGAGDGEIIALGGENDHAALYLGRGREIALSPAGEVVYSTDAFRYHAVPRGFIQANRFQLEIMQRWLREALDRPLERAVDLFAGAGFFSLPLSLAARHVTAVESDDHNAVQFRRNCRENGRGNIELIVADALGGAVPPAEAVVVDPPRGGLSQPLVAALTAARPRTLVYFSCDSASFARDLAWLRAAGWAVGDLRLIDNYPQTDHCEIFCLLHPAADRF